MVRTADWLGGGGGGRGLAEIYREEGERLKNQGTLVSMRVTYVRWCSQSKYPLSSNSDKSDQRDQRGVAPVDC